MGAALKEDEEEEEEEEEQEEEEEEEEEQEEEEQEEEEEEQEEQEQEQEQKQERRSSWLLNIGWFGVTQASDELRHPARSAQVGAWAVALRPRPPGPAHSH